MSPSVRPRSAGAWHSWSATKSSNWIMGILVVQWQLERELYTARLHWMHSELTGGSAHMSTNAENQIGDLMELAQGPHHRSLRPLLCVVPIARSAVHSTKIHFYWTHNLFQNKKGQMWCSDWDWFRGEALSSDSKKIHHVKDEAASVA